MGTRNLTCVVLNKQIRVAQYCQWDGYPGGQGKTVFNFIKNNSLRKFKQRVGSLQQISKEEVHAKWKECGADDSGWVGLDVSKKMEEKYPHLNRDCGAQVLELILNKKISEVNLSTDFAADSLFCEWAYVIDLDRKILEVYRGFVTNPHNEGRFANLSLAQEHRGESKYYPIKLLLEIPFKKLPATADEFVTLCNNALPPEERDED